MKKFISLILVAVMILSAITAFAEDPIKIYLDGKELETDVPPVIVNDRTMVPFRDIFEALGATVDWNGNLKKAYATLSDKMVILTIGSNKMLVYGGSVELDAPPFIHNDRTLIPIRAVCEVFGCTVDWHDESRSVIIRTQSYEGPELPEAITNPPEPSPDNKDDSVYNEVIVDDDAYFVKDSEGIIEEVISIINAKRVSEGAEALEYSDSLEAVAYSHCKDMADNDYLAHTSPSGETFDQRIDNAEIPYSSAAENIAAGFTSAEKVVASWMNSESHRNNLLNSEFTKVGLGYYVGGSNGTYWTLLLIAD